jgi:hypothetical protein
MPFTNTLAPVTTHVPVQTNFPSTAQPSEFTQSQAYVLGNAAPPFIDTTASYIWNTPSAKSGAAVGSVVFATQYNSSSASPQSATLHCIVDDSCIITVTNSQATASVVGQAKYGQYAKLPIELQPGNNVLIVGATNTGGPANLLISVLDAQGHVLFHSDDTWWTTNI